MKLRIKYHIGLIVKKIINKNNKFWNYMCMDSLYFLIPTVFILLLILPIFLEVKVSYNFLKNSGVICVYFSKIKFKYYIFEFHNNNIRLKDQREVSEKQIDFSSPELAVIEEFSKQIKQKARLKYLFVYYNVGLNDAFLTSVFCGCLNVALLIFFTSIKNSRPTASLCVYDNASYNNVVVEVAGDICVSLSLFDVVYSFLNSLILSKKKAKQAKM